MSRWLLVFCLARPAWAVDLRQYPYATETAPAAYQSLSAAEREKARELPTNEVRFLFHAPCSVGDETGASCLWAYVQPLSRGKIVLRRTTGAKTATLFVLEDDSLSLDYRARRKFVRLPDGITTVSGKSTVVTHWWHSPGGPPIPLIWLPVNPANQTRLNEEFYEGLSTRQGQRKLTFDGLQARRLPPGNSFFLIVELSMVEPDWTAHLLTVYRNKAEAEKFLGKVQSAVFLDAGFELQDLFAYTMTTERDAPRRLELLVLDGKQKGSTASGTVSQE